MGGVSRPEGLRPFYPLKLKTMQIKGSCGALRGDWPGVLAFGNLNNGVGNAGLSCLNGNNALSNANWNILARTSGKYGTIDLHRMAAAERAAGGNVPTLRGKWIAKPRGW